jgi:hypothetical protein
MSIYVIVFARKTVILVKFKNTVFRCSELGYGDGWHCHMQDWGFLV